MGKKRSLHPSVQAFKKFVKEHPTLVKEVKEGRKNWQDIYEEWTILGENHESWATYKYVKNQTEAGNETVEDESTDTTKAQSDENTESAEKSNNSPNVLDLLKKINVNDLQGHLTQFSGILSNIQGLMQTFQGGGGQGSNQQQTQQSDSGNQDNPFSFKQH
ncbi:spore coat protein YlbD [Bacillus alkalicellulosilyticus]|uniref:spore coat protein YlbD n=1 Tax=Alkalihalobacterium alkalicellulosilyticum TaxID=1912214 RepID=UPI000996CF9F|nr:spore coat protein YlbD [Bacillus alkalicellulosilyticus]